MRLTVRHIAIVTAIVLVGLFLELGYRQRPAERACQALITACRAHGYKLGHSRAKRESFYRECFLPLIEGQRREDFGVAQSVIDQCRAGRWRDEFPEVADE